jgi:hypothetical protein
MIEYKCVYMTCQSLSVKLRKTQRHDILDAKKEDLFGVYKYA